MPPMNYVAAASCVLLALPAQAEMTNPLLDLSLTDLMNISVDTAGNFSSSWRNQPGIITIFSTSDIQAMGARTLRDILLHIPGVSLGMDNHNAVGLMLRGNWTLEGKVQYLINDLPVNDVIFGTFPIPPYLPADQIERVEVLRGPGSAKYGDSAQLAVIRIYTRRDSQVAVMAMDQSGATSGVVSFSRHANLDDQGSLALVGSLNTGHWGAGTWVDNQGTAVNVAGIGTQGGNLAAELRLQRTSLQLIYNEYGMDAVQNFGAYSPAQTVRFRQGTAQISHEFETADQWLIKPRLSYHLESTWQDVLARYDIRGQRWDVGVDVSRQYAPDAGVNFGLLQQVQQARSSLSSYTPGDFYPAAGWRTVRNTALYGLWDFTVRDFNVSLGARATHNEYSGSSITPRLGLTKSTDRWHVKWLHGTATRDPNLEQINPANHPQQDQLNTERTRINEWEFGHVLTDHSYLTVSVFDQTIRSPIIYLPNPGGFTNNVPVKTRGLELQYWYRGPAVTLQANLSRSRANNDSGPGLYNVADQSGQFLGAAAHIANVWLEWRTPQPGLSLLLDFRLLGPRTAYAYSAAAQANTQQRLPTEKTVNLALRYQMKPMTLSVGVRNLTQTRQWIPQPYDASVPGIPGSTPFPVDGREWWLRSEWPL